MFINLINIFISESIKNLLGKQVKILFKNVVKLETKGDKTENRVLVSFFISIKSKGKMCHTLNSFHVCGYVECITISLLCKLAFLVLYTSIVAQAQIV